MGWNLTQDHSHKHTPKSSYTVTCFEQRCSRHHHWETASSNPDDATAINGWQREQKLTILFGWEGFSLSSVNQSEWHKPIVGICELERADCAFLRVSYFALWWNLIRWSCHVSEETRISFRSPHLVSVIWYKWWGRHGCPRTWRILVVKNDMRWKFCSGLYG